MYFQLSAGVRWLAVGGAFTLVKVVCLDDVSRAAGSAAADARSRVRGVVPGSSIDGQWLTSLAGRSILVWVSRAAARRSQFWTGRVADFNCVSPCARGLGGWKQIHVLIWVCCCASGLTAYLWASLYTACAMLAWVCRVGRGPVSSKLSPHSLPSWVRLWWSVPTSWHLTRTQW